MTTTTATAICLRCEWTQPEGTSTDVDKAAEKHTKTGHPTMTTITRRPA